MSRRVNIPTSQMFRSQPWYPTEIAIGGDSSAIPNGVPAWSHSLTFSRVLCSRLDLGEHYAVLGSLVGFKPHGGSVPHLSQMSGTNGADAYQALAHRIRVAHVSGRQLRSRRQGRRRDPFDEVEVFRAASAGLGPGMLHAPDGPLRETGKAAGRVRGGPLSAHAR